MISCISHPTWASQRSWFLDLSPLARKKIQIISLILKFECLDPRWFFSKPTYWMCTRQEKSCWNINYVKWNILLTRYDFFNFRLFPPCNFEKIWILIESVFLKDILGAMRNVINWSIGVKFDIFGFILILCIKRN